MKEANIDIRDAFFDRLYVLASQRDDFIVLSADMDAFGLRKIAKDYPEKYLHMGVAEQNMINVAAGLSMAGKKVICYFAQYCWVM